MKVELTEKEIEILCEHLTYNLKHSAYIKVDNKLAVQDLRNKLRDIYLTDETKKESISHWGLKDVT